MAKVDSTSIFKYLNSISTQELCAFICITAVLIYLSDLLSFRSYFEDGILWHTKQLSD